MTAATIPHGVNEENVIVVEETIAGPVADTADIDLTLPAQYLGQGLIPVAWNVSVESGGPAAVGARVWTLNPAEAAAGTGIQPISFTEATGVLKLSNQSGGPLSDIKVTALFVPAS